MSHRVVARPICNDNERSADRMKSYSPRCRVSPMTPAAPPPGRHPVARRRCGIARTIVATRLSLITVSYESAGLVERLADAVWACGTTTTGARRRRQTPHPTATAVSSACTGGRTSCSITADRNLGFGQGCMLGTKHARGDLLMFLNPDITPLDDVFESACRQLSRHVPSIAISFPKVVAPRRARRAPEPKLEDVSTSGGAAMLTSRAAPGANRRF